MPFVIRDRDDLERQLRRCQETAEAQDRALERQRFGPNDVYRTTARVRAAAFGEAVSLIAAWRDTEARAAADAEVGEELDRRAATPAG